MTQSSRRASSLRPPAIHYHNRIFRAVQNTAGGEVDSDTRFHYRQSGDLIWATYTGGSIRMGTLVGTCDAQGRLEFTYQHINRNDAVMTGRCRSTPEILGDGRLRLHEEWQWTSGDGSTGSSVIEEVRSRPGIARLPAHYAICRLDPASALPAWFTGDHLLAQLRTPDELTLVCPQGSLPDPLPQGMHIAPDWVCFQVEGPLDLSQTGILSNLAAPLANAQIPIFALSTYDTDYVLVPAAHADAAFALLADPSLAPA